jgi:hypothetical protein
MSTNLDKSPKGSKATLANLRAPRLEDAEEGTSEHVGDDSKSNVKSSMKSGALPMKKGKILVDLKHSGDYKAFSAAEKNVTTKMLQLKEAIRKDPLSMFTPELTEGLIMSMSDMAFYRPEKPVMVLSKNMGEYSVAGFDKSSKTQNEIKSSSKLPSRQATNNALQRPSSKDSKTSEKSKDSHASDKSKGSKTSKGSQSSKKSKKKVSKAPVPPIEESKNEDSDEKEESPGESDEEKGEAEGNEEGEGEGEGEDEAEEEGEEEGEEEEEPSKKSPPKKP